MKQKLEDLIPIFGVEQDIILSKQGDFTLAFDCQLPEVFTLSDKEYEAFHVTWVKAIKVLPRHTVFHKQDWFTEDAHEGDFITERSFLSGRSERFFNERPYLKHSCFIYLTKKPPGRKPSDSLLSNLFRRNLVPPDTLKPQFVQEFLDSAGQFRRILEDSGFVKLIRLAADDILSTKGKAGLLERYCYLSPSETAGLIGDLHFHDGLQIGSKHCQLFTLADVQQLPAYCGSRINYDKYSTDRSKFSVGFGAPLGLLLPCNHLYNQFLFMEDAAKTIQRLESKKLRLQSLSAYSRNNAIARDAVNAFLNEAVSGSRLPVKAHFNVLVWTEEKEKSAELKNLVTSWVTTMASPKNLRTVLKRYLIYSAMPARAIAFQASSIRMIFRTPLSLRIFEIKTSMMIMVTTGKRIGWSFIVSSSNTMKGSCSRCRFSSAFSR